ncbi:MAG TPA: MoaD/ThiS family protein [Acidimicrobiales bacterium]|nr:MoaD/ThiS family protein [Acidimicrobiales bacterium]
MARLRLFGPVREAAGLGEDELPGETLDELLAAARERYGARFSAVAERCVVWVNGEAAPGGTPLVAGDEVALLPPVSGG